MTLAPEETRSETDLLEVIGIRKQFVATLALDGVDLAIRRGEIHALLGQNGAGKSTLIKVLAGIYPATSGTVKWRGSIVDPVASRLPITFIHQDLGLVDGMTVAENVALLAGYPRTGGLIRWRSAATAAQAALRTMESDLDPGVRVGSLSAAEKSIVAIARALARKSDVLVLDEPTAALPAADVDLLLNTLLRLKASGIGLLYVTHRLDEVFRIADRVTVLRDGRRVGFRKVADTRHDELIEWIVGGALAATTFASVESSAERLLDVEHMVVPQDGGAGVAGPVSFTVHRRETLGLVGLRGAGHHAVGRALFGALPIRSGRIKLNGRAVRLPGPAAAMDHGIGFVSSRRAEESLAGKLTALENLYVNARARKKSAFALVARDRELASGAKALARFSVRPPDPRRVIETFSGGNQQKVVVARWMESDADLLILEEPTIGVDVGAKAEIYRDLDAAHERGRAVLLVSSDFEEVERICHRALVFDRGRIVAEVHRPNITVASLTSLSTGATKPVGTAP